MVQHKKSGVTFMAHKGTAKRACSALPARVITWPCCTAPRYFHEALCMKPWTGFPPDLLNV